MRTIVFLYLLVAAPVWAGEPIRIAVAANFKPTLQKITEPFLANSGIVVTYSSASSGALTTQIINGAPYDIFFAADSETTKTILAAPGHEQDQIFCYARGSLVLAGGNGKLSALANPNLSLAIANPATAPYGRAAREVLARPEFSAGEGRKLVRGNSAAQAYQFWEGGSVKMALLPRAKAWRKNWGVSKRITKPFRPNSTNLFLPANKSSSIFANEKNFIERASRLRHGFTMPIK